MQGLPKFPPRWYEWSPGDLTKFQLPLPRWLTKKPGNPGPEWLGPEDRDRLERLYGYWAVRRAESFAPVGNTVVAELMAAAMAERMRAGYGLPAVIEEVKRKVKRKVATA